MIYKNKPFITITIVRRINYLPIHTWEHHINIFIQDSATTNFSLYLNSLKTHVHNYAISMLMIECLKTCEILKGIDATNI